MKTVIITGAGGNLGKAAVMKFSVSGYKVIAVEHKQEALDVFKGNSNIGAYVLNATDETDTMEFVQKITANSQSIDAALMIVGGYADGTIENTGQKELEKMFSLNFYTAYFMARNVFMQMLKQKSGGKLVFISAAPALSDAMGYPMVGYTLAKTLVLKLAKILNSEGHKKNINCAVIAPTTIDTPQNRTSMPDADFNKWTTAEDIASMMEFFCSAQGDKMKDVVIKM